MRKSVGELAVVKVKIWEFKKVSEALSDNPGIYVIILTYLLCRKLVNLGK